MKRGTEPLTPDEVREILKGIALFTGGIALAAWLKPQMPWSKKQPTQQQPSDTTETPGKEEGVATESE